MSLALVQRLPGTGDQHIFAGFEGGQLLIFDLRAGGKLACEASSVSSTPSPLLALDVTQDAKMVICGTSSEEMSAVKIDWNTFEMSWKPFYTLNKGGIGHICIRPDQKLFATGGWDTRVRIFHRKTRKPLASLKYHTESVFGLDFSMDNTLLASASKDKRIALWKVFPPSNAYKPSSLFS
jgi:WD40 repeat protein